MGIDAIPQLLGNAMYKRVYRVFGAMVSEPLEEVEQNNGLC